MWILIVKPNFIFLIFVHDPPIRELKMLKTISDFMDTCQKDFLKQANVKTISRKN